MNAIWINAVKQRKNGTPLVAVGVDNSGYPAALEVHKIYRVLSDDDAAADGDLRVIDESGEDYLYSVSRFILMELPQAVKRALLHAPKTERKAASRQSREGRPARA